jgi:ParB family transcriptional regulator, chromosome partitioning protein
MPIESVNAADCRVWHLHARGDVLDEDSCASLIDSIRANGQRIPVLGRRCGPPGEAAIELIYGARRLFAAQYLGIELLVDVRELDDRAALIAMDIENRVRADISPYERGMSHRSWLSAGYFSSQADLAAAVGISEAQVSRLLRYAELPAAVVGAFSSPAAIKEQWAVTLAKRCQDPTTRQLTVRRARESVNSQSHSTPQALYAALVHEGPRSVADSRSRDQVVQDRAGKPLVRIGFRSRAVHIILPKEKVTPRVLRQISEYLRTILALDFEPEEQVHVGSADALAAVVLVDAPADNPADRSSMLKGRNTLIPGAARAERRALEPTSWQGKRG